MTTDDRRSAWLEREMRDENMLRAMRQGALDHGWVLSYREAQEVAEAMLPALTALVAAPLGEMEEALVAEQSRAQYMMNLTGPDRVRWAEVFQACSAALARLSWREEGETKERDTLHIAAQRADGALADAATVPTGNLEHGIRLLTGERDALRAEVAQLAKWKENHEHCIKGIQADQLTIANRENELHDEKDTTIKRLRAALTAAQLFLKAGEHIHSHSGAMNATQIAREEHYRQTRKAIDAILIPEGPAHE